VKIPRYEVDGNLPEVISGAVAYDISITFADATNRLI
jgi:hypothetical protein